MGSICRKGGLGSSLLSHPFWRNSSSLVLQQESQQSRFYCSSSPRLGQRHCSLLSSMRRQNKLFPPFINSSFPTWRTNGGRPDFSRMYMTLPKPLSLLRLPIYFAAASAGVVSYVGYKTKELTDKYVPDWIKSSFGNLKDAWQSLDLSRLEWEFSLPDVNGIPILEAFTWPFSTSPESASSSSDSLESPGGHKMHQDPNRDEEEGGGGNEDKGNHSSEGIIGMAAVVTSATEDSSIVHPFKPFQTNESQNENELLGLTRKLIQVRNILKTIKHEELALQLPSIVVIGSQSSGKSSVLEAIVGQEFLPKGNNMVTRRPIELTLINTPPGSTSTAEFPHLKLQFTDFTAVQRTLMDLNLAVPESQCISSEPIELIISSPLVPDLSLIDLPGYIAIPSSQQPQALKAQIQKLCAKYIVEPNLILAISPANVDLANSESLNAAKALDPLGKRTIGVMTKMDLVEDEIGVGVLSNTNYPLALGYVGVVCGNQSEFKRRKDNESLGLSNGRLGGSERSGFFGFSSQDPDLSNQSILNRESSFFQSHFAYSNQIGISVGIPLLRKKLIHVLESSISSKLDSILNVVRDKLSEVRYDFKVHYNDRILTPEFYLSETLDALKSEFKVVKISEFGKPKVRERVSNYLESQVMGLLQLHYWEGSKFEASKFQSECSQSPEWSQTLDLVTSNLTMSGIGKSCTSLVISNLTSHMENLISKPPFSYHPAFQNTLRSLTKALLTSKLSSTIDQVENCIKPFKYEVEMTPEDWRVGIDRANSFLNKELDKIDQDLTDLKRGIGRKSLRRAIRYLKSRDSDVSSKVSEDQGNKLTMKSEHSSSRTIQKENFSDSSDSPSNSETEREVPSSGDDGRWMNRLGWGILPWFSSFENLASKDPNPNPTSFTTPTLTTTNTPNSIPTVTREELPFSSSLLTKAQQAQTLLRYGKLINTRKRVLQSSDCYDCPTPGTESLGSEGNKRLGPFWSLYKVLTRQIGHPALPSLTHSNSNSNSSSSNKYTNPSNSNSLSHSDFTPSPYACCPEIFLMALSSKLAYTTVLFLHYELLSEFFHSFPKEVDKSFGYGSNYELNRLHHGQVSLTPKKRNEKDSLSLSEDFSLPFQNVFEFAMENPKVAQQLESQEVIGRLEECVERLQHLVHDQKERRGQNPKA